MLNKVPARYRPKVPDLFTTGVSDTQLKTYMKKLSLEGRKHGMLLH